MVGIGASADSVRSLQRLIQHIPADSGVAWLIVTQAAPAAEHPLADLLQPHTSLPIQEVQGETGLVTDQIYVIPPHQHPAAIDTHLRLITQDEAPRVQTPLDHFLRILADSHGTLAVGVVLSGPGSDGALGLARIKEQGGLPVVQEPEEAEQDNMPRAAITIGQADLVLPAAEIPRQILAYLQRARPASVDSESEDDQTDLRDSLPQVLSLVRLHTGQDFTRYKQGTLLRRIQHRIQVLGMGTVEHYVNRLDTDPAEGQALANDFLITVTNFFRDPAAFDFLATEVIPQLFRHKTPNDTVRVWVVGCATGEEAYSLVILLLEYASQLEQPPRVQILASDLSERALQWAREGFYPETIAQDVSAERLDRFFVRVMGGYRVRQEVRELVLFALHNVIKDPPFSRVDLISCRNVLIYMERELQQQILELFHYALRPQGFLFLGVSEAADNTDLFETVSRQQSIYRREGVRPELTPPTLPLVHMAANVSPAPPRGSTAPAPRDPGMNYGLIYGRMVEQHGPPGLLVDAEYNVVYYARGVNRYLDTPPGAPTHQVLQRIHTALSTELTMALFHAFMRNESSLSAPIELVIEGVPHRVRISVAPETLAQTPGGPQKLALVLFHEVTEEARQDPNTLPEEADDQARELMMLREHVQILQEEFGVSKEEMHAANEELQSTNEELRAMTEELETSKEELQSTNEELLAVNQENKHRLDELSQLSSDLRNLLAATDIATLFLDRELRITRFTPRASDLFNVLATDRGRPLAHITHHLDYVQLLDDAEQVLRTLVPISREVRSQSGVWYLVRLLPYRSVEDQIQGVVITLVDITANKQTEQALRVSEERQRLLIESVRDYAIFTLDPTGLVTSWNEGARRLKGYTADEIIGRPVHCFYLPEDVAANKPEQEMQTALNTGRSEDESWRLRKNGERLWVNEVMTPLRAEDGTLLGFTKISRDLSVRKANEEALRQSEERLRVTMESVTDYAIITHDEQGIITTWNPGAEQMFGYRAEEAIGQSSSLIFTPEDRARGAPKQELIGARQTGRAADERWHQRKDGSRLFVSGVMVPLQAPGTNGFVKVARDLTERKQSEELLEREVAERTAQVRELVTQLTMTEQEERRRVSAILHDDLQQRLFSLLFQLALLRRDLTDVPEGVLQQIGEIEGELHDAIQTARELSVDLSPPVLHNEGLVEALRWLASLMARQQGLAVEVQTENTIPLLHQDLRVLLFQTVRELLFNVVKHAGVNTARVILRAQNYHLQIEVRDEGRGFTPHIGTRVQTSQGLIRMEQRLQLLGGYLQIHSRMGAGTRIVIELPLDGKSAAPQASEIDK